MKKVRDILPLSENKASTGSGNFNAEKVGQVPKFLECKAIGDEINEGTDSSSGAAGNADVIDINKEIHGH